MKANLNTLKQALQLTGKAHRAEFCDWTDEDCIALHDDALPITTDVRMICMAFYGSPSMVHQEWGYTCVYLEEGTFLPKVDMGVLGMALPYGWIDEIEDQES